MRIPRNLDGDTLARHLIRRWDYIWVRQTGSHVRLQTQIPSEQAITVPLHTPLKTGTLTGILKTVSVHKGVETAALLEGL